MRLENFFNICIEHIYELYNIKIIIIIQYYLNFYLIYLKIDSFKQIILSIQCNICILSKRKLSNIMLYVIYNIYVYIFNSFILIWNVTIYNISNKHILHIQFNFSKYIIINVFVIYLFLVWYCNVEVMYTYV